MLTLNTPPIDNLLFSVQRAIARQRSGLKPYHARAVLAELRKVDPERSRRVNTERVRKGTGITKRELNALIQQRFYGKSMSFLSLDELEGLID